MNKTIQLNTKGINKQIQQEVLRAQQGDENAFLYIMGEMLPHIRSAAKRVVAPGFDFEDAVQEGFIGLYGAVQTFQPEKGANFRTYASRCISNAVVSAFRMTQAKKHGPLNYASGLEEESTIDLAQSPEEQAIQKEQYAEIQKSIQKKLSALEKTVLKEYMAGKTYDEIALVVEGSAKTAEMLMTFSMQRQNIISYGDYGIRKGLRMLYRHKEITKPRFERYKARYSPYASVAALYLWAIAGGAIDGLQDPAPKNMPKGKLY